MTAKESKRWRRAISSNAFALNADMGQTAKSWAEFRKQGVDLTKAVGGKGMGGAIRNLIKITATLGIEGQQLALMFSGLIKGFGFTTKRARALIDTVFVMGKAFNVGKEVTQEMPGILQSINKELADFGIKASPKDVERYTLSIVKLGIGLKESLGMNIKDATATAKNLFSTLLGERKNIINMFRGMGGEMGELAKILAEKGGVGKALQMIQQEPAKFLDALADMYKKAMKNGGQMSVGLQRLMGGVMKMLGPDMTFAMSGNWDKASAAMKKLGGISKDTSKNLGALSKAANKAYKSGRTAQDAFTIMLQMQEARIQSLTQPMLSKWITEQRTGFNNFYGTLKGLASEKGPLGEITRRLLLMQRVGLSGLFSGMGGAAPLILKSIQQMGPMLSALAAAGMSLASFGKLLLPGGILMIGMAAFNKEFRDKITKTIEKGVKFLREKIPEWAPRILEGLKELWYKAVDGVRWLMDIVSPMMVRLADAISKVDWAGLAQRFISFMGKMFRGVFNAVFGGGAFEADMTTAEGRFQAAGVRLIGAMGRAMLDMAAVALYNLGALFFDWSDGFMESGAQKLSTIGGILMTALFFGRTRMLAIKGMMWLAAKFVTTLFLPVMASAAAFVKGMIFKQATMFAVMGGQLKWFSAQAIGAWLALSIKQAAIAYAGMLKTVGSFLWGLATMNTALMKTALKMAAGWLIAMGPVGWVIAAIGAVSVAIYLMRDKIGDALGVVGDFFKWLGEKIWKYLSWPFRKVAEYAGKAWDAIKDVASSAFNAIRGESESTKISAINDAAGTAFAYANKQIEMVQANYNATRDMIANAGHQATQVAMMAGQQANTVIKASEMASSEQTKNFKSSANAIEQSMTALASSIAGSWAAVALAAKQATLQSLKMQRVALMAMGKTATSPVIKTLDEKIAQLQKNAIRIATEAKSIAAISDWVTANVRNQKDAAALVKAISDFQARVPTEFAKRGMTGEAAAKFIHNANALIAENVKRDIKRGVAVRQVIADVRRDMVRFANIQAERWARTLAERAMRASGYDPTKQTGVREKWAATIAAEMKAGRMQGRDISKMTGQQVMQLINRAAGRSEPTRTGPGRRFVPTAITGKGRPQPAKPGEPAKPMPSAGFAPGGEGGPRKTLIDKDLSDETKKTMISVGQAVDNLSQAVNSLQGRIKVDVNIYGDLRKFLKWYRANGASALAPNPTAAQ